MLFESPFSFTEILSHLGIDSPQLSFHVKTLKELVKQMVDGKYSLSEFGKAACSLTGMVEESEKTAVTMIGFKWALAALLVAVLVPFVAITPGPLGPGTSWKIDLGLLPAILILMWRYFKAKKHK
jgi:hypothetical protein